MSGKKAFSYRHTLLNSAGTLLSRVTGMARQIIVNYFFGVKADSFVAAFYIPNTLRRTVGEGALANSFIPVYQKALAQNGGESASRFASNILNIFLISTVLLSVLAAVLAPFYFPLLVPGFRSGHISIDESVRLVMLMMPFVVFISLFSIAMGILQSHQRFFATAFTPILWNAAIILFPILTINQLGIYSLAAGVVTGGALMFAGEWIALKKMGFQYQLVLDLKDPMLKDFSRLFWPTSLNMLLLTSKDILASIFVSSFVGGFIIRLNAFTLIEAPLGVIGLAIGTVLLPLLARFKSEKDHGGFEKSLSQAFYLLLFLTIPVTAYFLFYPDTVFQTFFRDVMRLFTGHTGRLSAEMVPQNVSALFIYSTALLPMSCVYLFERVFYAAHDARTPLLANILTVVLSLGLYFLSFIPALGFSGILLAEAAAAWAVFFFYLIFRLKHVVPPSQVFRPLVPRLVLLTGASLLGVLAAGPVHKYLYLKAQTAWTSIFSAALEFGIFAAVYTVLAFVFRSMPRRHA